MHNFKKICYSLLSFVVIFIVILSVLIVPYEKADTNDSSYRKEMAGTLDTLYCGSSHGHYAFDVRIIDKILNTNSYNLCDGQMSMLNINLLVKKEIARNPVKTVVIDIHRVAFNDMTFDAVAESGAYFISRLDTPKEKIKYFFDSGMGIGLDRVLSLKVNSAIRFWEDKLKGNDYSGINRSLKGVALGESINLVEEEKKTLFVKPESKEIEAGSKSETNYKYIKFFDEIVTLCHEKNINVFVVITPLSDIQLTKYDDYDGGIQWIKEHCKKINCKVLDFNLYKGKSNLLSDVISYCDLWHLSEDGAAVFSKIYAETMLKAKNGENIEDLFYSSYEEAMPYNKWHKYLLQENN